MADGTLHDRRMFANLGDGHTPDGLVVAMRSRVKTYAEECACVNSENATKGATRVDNNQAAHANFEEKEAIWNGESSKPSL